MGSQRIPDSDLLEIISLLEEKVRRLEKAEEEHAKAQAAVISPSEYVNENNRMAEALRVSEAQLKSIVLTSQEWIWAADAQGVNTFSNPAIFNILGYRPDEMMGQSPFSFLHQEDIPKAKETLLRCLAQKTGWPNLVLRWRHKNGTYRYLESNAVPIVDGKGDLSGFQGSDRDITERMRMEKAMRESAEQLRAISENIADGMVYQINSGTDGRQRFFSYLSPAIESLHGLTADDVRRRPSLIYDQIEEGYRHDIVEAETQAYQTMSKLDIDLPIRLPSGEIRWRRFISSPRKLSDGSVVWDGIELDITERIQAQEEKNRLQQRLQQAEKMEAIGILAGGVAHDLNNVLGLLVGYADMLKDHISQGSHERTYIEKIIQGGVRATAIIGDLLALSGKDIRTENIININSIIADFQKTSEFENFRVSYPQVRMQFKLAGNLLNIKGSAPHLSKALMHLLINAAEAMPHGGALCINTGNRHLDRPVRGYDDVREGDYVTLTITDTGAAVTGEDMKRLFEPFYTKRVMGRSATGSGLAIVWGTVKNHQGYIDVQSKQGKGTSITLYLPVAMEILTGASPSVPLCHYLGNNESILVIDDIEEQRELACTILGRLNYKVITAGGGEEAAAYLKSNRVDLVVLDMVMSPGMDGLETYKRILELHPKQKAIIVSGFSESEHIQAVQALGAGPYLKKPYIREKLGMAVRNELDRME